ncbi:uncharacterized protein LOC143282362 [Babylonia areolata]|uniref:uncharacterized protein LOC143282362 n=1 Tax=Babylonia areolata TaxID=304850 RepID=UPI003FD13270
MDYTQDYEDVSPSSPPSSATTTTTTTTTTTMTADKVLAEDNATFWSVFWEDHNRTLVPDNNSDPHDDYDDDYYDYDDYYHYDQSSEFDSWPGQEEAGTGGAGGGGGGGGGEDAHSSAAALSPGVFRTLRGCSSGFSGCGGGLWWWWWWWWWLVVGLWVWCLVLVVFRRCRLSLT